jgi:hypothetical protein
MDGTIFSGIAQVEIQGKAVLEFISLTKAQAEFDVIGLTDPTIRVIDRRPAVKRKMKEILKTEKVEQLADYFSQPARVTILHPVAGQMVVRLEKTRAKKPQHTLWMAIGIDEQIPYFNYKKIRIRRLENNKFAVFYLYKKTPQPDNAIINKSPKE